MNHLVITNPALCIGCHIYEVACLETYRQYGLQSIPHLKVMLNEKESAPQLCHQCEDVPCATVYPVNAINRVDGVAQLNESLCVGYRLCGIACPLGAIEFSGSRPLHIPVNASTSEVSLAPPAPAYVSSLLDWVPGVRVIAAKCDLYSFDEQGPVCARMCPTKAPHLVSNMDIAYVSKRRRELAFNTDFGNFTSFQRTQSGDVE